ncbi:MAG: hypothetical protein KC593_25430 [Myxococcales bacterium]|nr:hypothetical protein [Myxococcales bacterium]
MNSKLAQLIARDAAAFTPSQLRLLVNVVVVVAHADLDIDEAEREGIRLALESAIGHALESEELTQQIAGARQRIAAAGSVRFAEQVGVNLAEAKLGRAGAELAYAIAASSGGISEDERARLRAMTRGAKLPADVLAQIEAAAAQTAD